MTILQDEAPIRLKVDGFRKPLRLRSRRRDGALETFAVEGEILEAVRFFPTGAVREAGGRLTAIPEAAEAYAAALDDFETLGLTLQAATPRAVLPVEAVARAAGGCFWLQSPSGLTLEGWLADHPGPVSEPIVAAFARRLGEALGELHAAGMVHGDLSPRAVLLDEDQVRLTGFMIDRRPLFRALRSQSGLVEPGYAPPEAHDGARRRPIGPAADLYAASALLQRLLTGRPPLAANLPARVAGDNPWPGDIGVSAGLRAGVDAGLAPDAEARPADAAAWLDSLDLKPGPATAPWFDGVAATAPTAPPPRPTARPLAAALSPPVEPPPIEPVPEPASVAEAPLTLARETSARRRFGRWAGAAGLAVAVGALALSLGLVTRPRPETQHTAAAPDAAPAAPAAPAGCQWLSAAGGWRLQCSDAPAQGLRLPERFDAQTAARASAGEPAAMERLGAFYRLRAGETANADRGAYAYQALGWLQRAAAAPEDGRADTARARDDATLALGQMLARGEGGRAPDPAGAERRLRQAAAGSRADAVLALGQFLESQAAGDAARLAEARGLYARVAQLGDGSALQREGERGLVRIDAATPPPPAPAPVTLAERPEPAPAKPSATKPTVKPTRKPVAKPASLDKAPVVKASTPRTAPARPVAKPAAAKPTPPPRARPTVPVARTTPKPTSASPRRIAAAPRIPTPTPAAPAPTVLRHWTTSTFVQVDPTTNFDPAVQAAGRAACARDGGQAQTVRAGEAICPNGVNYCQVRAVAACEGE